MERKTYSTRSNAKRAAEKFGLPYTLTGNKESGFVVVVRCENAAQTEEARSKGFATEDLYTEETAVDLDTLGLYGTGSNEENAVCPHCGINHIDNGYQTADGIADAGGTCEREYVCLACGGEWGPKVQGFAAKLASHMAGGKSKCASLRQIAHEWAKGDRKGYMAAAVAAGIKPATASANWAAMRRGEW